MCRPFTLDDFQRQAIGCLEKRENVLGALLPVRHCGTDRL
jgi:hypothetical protein